MSFIIYLGWGSLLWDHSNLKLKSPWIPSSIKLPLEFSRISDKGAGRLTLVIDKKNGKLIKKIIELEGLKENIY